MSSNEASGFPEAVLLIPKPHDSTSAYANGVVSSMTGNPHFNPAPPELATLATDADLYQKAIAAASNKGRVEVRARNALRRKVVADLHHLRDSVQAVAEAQASPADAATVISSAGMRIRKVTKRNKPPVSVRQGAV